MGFAHGFVVAVALAPAAVAQATAAVRWCDPAAGEHGNPGTTDEPWPGLSEAIAAGALRDLPAGTVVRLVDGDHGAVRLAADDLVIEAAPGARPRLTRFELDRGERVTVRGLVISPEFGERFDGHIVRIGERGPARDVTVEGCFVCTVTDATDWDAEDWRRANHGMLQGRHGEAITFRDNYVRNTRFAIELASPHSACVGNIVRDFSGDGIRVMRDGIRVAENVISNAWLDPKHGDDNHDDAIQCFLFNKGSGTVRDVVVEHNLILGREDTGNPLAGTAQGIGFFDGPLVGHRIEGNVVLVDHWHGVSLYDARDCSILDNACYSRWPGDRKPWVKLGRKRHDPSGNVVRDNLAHAFKLDADPGCVDAGNGRIAERSFTAMFRALAKRLEGRLGAVHATSGLPRVPWRPDA